MTPTYRERLRLEGAVLAGAGALASSALVAFVPASRRGPLNTLGQLAVVVGLLGLFGRRSVRGSLERADEVAVGAEGSGEPTPLWHVIAVMAGATAVFVALPATGLPGAENAGWDAGLRVTAGCALVGGFQAVVAERMVAADERSTGRRYVRAAGSRLGRGTKLAFTRA